MFRFRLPLPLLSTLLSTLLAALLPALAPPPAAAGDISPLNLPSQRQQSVYRSPAALSAERNQYYADFERDMAATAPAQRKTLASEFARKLDAASSDEERAHYRRLLQILDKF